jgi:hypothetical protein
MAYALAAGGEMVVGIYEQPLTLTSARLAVIDSGESFALVPWTPDLERHRGRHVSGVV